MVLTQLTVMHSIHSSQSRRMIIWMMTMCPWWMMTWILVHPRMSRLRPITPHLRMRKTWGLLKMEKATVVEEETEEMEEKVMIIIYQ
jgi:hypothetical protein